jgi:hypothetical protein
MAKIKLTAGRIADFKCDEGKAQSFLWCNAVPGLGLRATVNGAKLLAPKGDLFFLPR